MLPFFFDVEVVCGYDVVQAGYDRPALGRTGWDVQEPAGSGRRPFIVGNFW